MTDRPLEDIIRPYIGESHWGGSNIDPREEWDTDDLIELGVIINKILKERDG